MNRVMLTIDDAIAQLQELKDSVYHIKSVEINSNQFNSTSLKTEQTRENKILVIKIKGTLE